MKKRPYHLLLPTLSTTVLLSLTACSEAPEDRTSETQQDFFQALASHCGQAFEGARVVARTDREDMLQGDEALVVYFAECSDKQIFAPFHIGPSQDETDWDRSRTWIYSAHANRLELRHDHRLVDGSQDLSNTMYGGFTETAGRQQNGVHIQRFTFTERTGPQGEELGWQIEVEPGVRYTYGTYQGADWTWRVDFDLRQPVEAPPPAWGHENGYIEATARY